MDFTNLMRPVNEFFPNSFRMDDDARGTCFSRCMCTPGLHMSEMEENLEMCMSGMHGDANAVPDRHAILECRPSREACAFQGTSHGRPKPLMENNCLENHF